MKFTTANRTRRSRRFAPPLALALALVTSAPVPRASAQSTGDAHGDAAAAAAGSAALDRLPLAFVENVGQFATPARFVVRHRGQVARFERDAIVLQLTRRDGERTHGALLRLEFEGAGAGTTLEGVARQECRYNYFLGNDRAKWRADVAAYSEVVYRHVAPGVDVRVRDSGGDLEYDLLLAPGADLEKVVLRCRGAKSLTIGADGVLALETGLGTLRQTLPRTWQEDAAGAREPVACRYRRIDDERFGFEVAARDASRRLVIDPHLDWSSYLGGSGEELPRCVVVDANGMVNVSGDTTSLDFPTTPGAWSPAMLGTQDAFIARLDPNRSGAAQLLWCTYFGADGDESGAACVVDAAGRILSGGKTDSTDFPTTPGAFQTTMAGIYDGFLICLDPSLTGTQQLVWSTYFGGSDTDFTKIPLGGVDANGIVTVTGHTRSSDLPTTPGAYDTTHNGGWDPIVARFDPSQSGAGQLLYSTFLGGSDEEINSGHAVDAAGRVYLCGSTPSNDFPTTPGAFSTARTGDVDGWFALLSPDGQGAADLLYSTYFGGTAYDDFDSLRVDEAGTVFLTGTTQSGDLPTTAGAYDTTFHGPSGESDAFVVRLDPRGNGGADLLYSTFLGGSGGSDSGHSVALGHSGEVTVSGHTTSSDFPTTDGAFQSTYGGNGDGFVVRLRPAGTGLGDLTYSTFLGGTGDDEPFDNRGLDLDAKDFPIVLGRTNSNDFPTTATAFQTANAGGYDGFVTRLALASWRNYGAGLAGTLGVPPFTAASNPALGGALALDIGNSRGVSTPALLLIGFADANLSAAGGTILVNAFVFLPIPLPAGGLPLNGSLPNDPNLCGFSLYLQALEADPAASHGISFTPGVRLILGY